MDLITQFLFPLGAAVPKVVGNWIETRNAIRLEYTKARLTEDQEQARHRRDRELREISAISASYPLGPPGRLRTLLTFSGLPLILVSPLPPGAWFASDVVPARIQGLLQENEKLGSYAQPVSGAFVRDAGLLRFVEGDIGARAIARYEFGGEPAVLVYFEQASNALVARAYLSTIFGSVGGDSAFSFIIARYSRVPTSNTSPVTSLGGDLPAWRVINLDAFPESDPVEIVAHTITWFLLAVVDAYWMLKAGIHPGLLTVSGVASSPALVSASVRHARLEREKWQLTAAGLQVTSEEITDRYVGVHVQGSGKDVVFVLDDRYPDSPPAEIRASGASFEIDASDWSPECNLMDVVEALP